MIEAYRSQLSAASCIRVINYHNTPGSRSAQFNAEFAALAQSYAPVTETALDRYLTSGDWNADRPGIIPAFYNGYRNNYDVVLPLLEAHGLTGWFFAVPGYTSCPVDDQLAFGARHTLKTMAKEYPDGRYALSWDELRDMDRRGHVVASHTRTHSRVSADDPSAFVPEIVGAQEDFSHHLGHEVRAFAWLFGGRYGENPAADNAVDQAGYDFLFSNFAVQRLPRGRHRLQTE